MKPLRTNLNYDSLRMIGIPKLFCDKNIEDFKTFEKSSLMKVKYFVQGYIENIEQNFKENKGICFIGSNGVGKSFLASLILKEAYRHRFSCRRVTLTQYISAYTEKWEKKGAERDVLEQDLMDKYKGVDFLVLEELGKEIDSRIVKPILEDLLRYRDEKGLVTLICANLSPENLRALYGNSVCSLINGNTTVVIIEGEDKRQKVYNGELL